MPHHLSLLYFLLLAIQQCLVSAEIDAENIARSASSSVMLVLAEDGTDGTAQGTGFIVSQDGLLVTNNHVINGANKLLAKSNTGGIYPVIKVLVTDQVHDIAIIQLKATNMPFLKLADSSIVNAGSKVVVIGNPVGLVIHSVINKCACYTLQSLRRTSALSVQLLNLSLIHI